MINIRYEPNNIIVQIPKDIATTDYIQRFLQHLRIESILENSQLSDTQIEELSETVKADWWITNKSRFITGHSD